MNCTLGKCYAIYILPQFLKNHWGLETFKPPPQKLLTSEFFFKTVESPALRFHSDGVSSLPCSEQTNKKANVEESKEIRGKVPSLKNEEREKMILSLKSAHPPSRRGHRCSPFVTHWAHRYTALHVTSEEAETRTGERGRLRG